MKGISRRRFLQTGTAAGVAFKVSLLAPPVQAQLMESAPAAGPNWASPAGRPRYRLDALAKVTGAKTFSRDYRARDLPGWPAEQSHAFLIRATKADHAFQGISLAVLGDGLKPDRVVMHEDLVRDGVLVPNPDFYGDTFLVPHGSTPRLLGQPVALLIYEDFARFDAAKRRVQFDDTVVQYGAKTPYNPPPNYEAVRYVRIEGDRPDAEDEFSPYKDTIIFGTFSGDEVVWPHPGRDDVAGRGMQAAGRIAQDISAASDSEFLLKRHYFSQSIDPSAMEADNGNVWYDADRKVLHMLVATQSPYAVAKMAAQLASKSNFQVQQLDLKIGYTVGYGSKDHHVFPLFCAVAGLYGNGRPVRLANNRFEQFQMGLKRHPFWMDNTLLLDRKTGKIHAMVGRFKSDGGGRKNYSADVAGVGASAAQSIYYLPKSDFSTAAYASRAVEAGSMRGYGTLQTMSATEMMIDEAAEILGIDPIELRLRNVLRSGMKNTQGAIPGGALRNDDILNRARAHPLWQRRSEKKKTFEDAHPGKRYGVGYAQVQKDYGSGAEAALASIEFDAKGQISFRHVAQEIGTGSTTSQAVMVGELLGRLPDQTEYGAVRWPHMPLESTDQPYNMPQEEEDLRKKNPRWTPRFTSAASASNSVYFFGHATREAARALIELSLWPAARSIWSRGIGGGLLASLDVSRADLRLAEGKAEGGGLPPISFETLASEAHRLGLVTGITVHTFNRWQWATAEFDIPGHDRVRLAADAAAVRYGNGASADKKALMAMAGWHFIERASVSYPPVQRNNVGVTLYAPVATLVELSVDTGSGEVEVLSHHSILDCGPQVVPELVSGQLQGGAAMGIGHALTEYLPLYEGGPGDGTWNWNRYVLPRAKNVAVWRQTADILPPLSDTDPPKGIAEVVMIAVVPATANAIAHAIGKRFYELPITPEKIRKALS